MRFLGLFPSEEEKLAWAAAKESKSQEKQEAKEPQKEPRKKAKEREWSDVNENVKFVCRGGKVQCPFAMPPIAQIIPTANDVMLQDKPFATTGDNNGKVNFNFTGVCTHPSQQKPFSPPPPCKAIISLGKWKNYSDTKINNDNALLVKSTIPCMISGHDLKIIHSGQVAVLAAVAPRTQPNTSQQKDKIEGGAYKDLDFDNTIAPGKKKETIEQRHHMPSQAAGNRGGDGGAITMKTTDHKETASFDKKPGAEEYRRKQKELVDSGNLAEAFEMDVKDIKSKFGDAYDDAIEQLSECYKSQGKL